MTLRELDWMIDGKLTTTWQQTAWMTAAIMNSQFGRTQAVHPRNVDPYNTYPEPVEENFLDGILGLE